MSAEGVGNVLVRSYENWTEADRRGTRWLAAIVGAAGLVALSDLDLFWQAMGETNSGLARAVLLVLMISGTIILFNAFRAESDADADFSYWLSNRPTDIGEAVKSRRLLAETLPYGRFDDILSCNDPLAVAEVDGLTSTAYATQEELELGLPKLLDVHTRLRWASTYAPESHASLLTRT